MQLKLLSSSRWFCLLLTRATDETYHLFYVLRVWDNWICRWNIIPYQIDTLKQWIGQVKRKYTQPMDQKSDNVLKLNILIECGLGMLARVELRMKMMGLKWNSNFCLYCDTTDRLHVNDRLARFKIRNQKIKCKLIKAARCCFGKIQNQKISKRIIHKR